MKENTAWKKETNSGAIQHKTRSEIYLDKTFFVYTERLYVHERAPKCF